MVIFVSFDPEVLSRRELINRAELLGLGAIVDALIR
jgi:hypothetical protein